MCQDPDDKWKFWTTNKEQVQDVVGGKIAKHLQSVINWYKLSIVALIGPLDREHSRTFENLDERFWVLHGATGPYWPYWPYWHWRSFRSHWFKKLAGSAWIFTPVSVFEPICHQPKARLLIRNNSLDMPGYSSVFAEFQRFNFGNAPANVCRIEQHRKIHRKPWYAYSDVERAFLRERTMLLQYVWHARATPLHDLASTSSKYMSVCNLQQPELAKLQDFYRFPGLLMLPSQRAPAVWIHLGDKLW